MSSRRDYAEKRKNMLKLVPYPKKIDVSTENFFQKPTYADENLLSFCQRAEREVVFEKDTALALQGYRLRISENQITVFYADEDGKFYALVTLKQYFDNFAKNVPCADIEDQPILRRRGVQLCLGQFDFRPKDKWMEKFLADMAYVKINEVVLYLEWNFSVSGVPLFSHGITVEQMLRWEKTAEKYRITLIPAVNILGHSDDLLAYEALSEIAESPTALCPSKNGTFLLAEKVIEDLCKLKSPIVHLGGDEVGAFGKCNDCKEKFAQKGKLGLYLEYFTRLNELLLKKGKKMALWSDQILMLMDGARFWIGCDVGVQYREQDTASLLALKDNLVVFDWWYVGANDDACNFFEKYGIEYTACGSTYGYISNGVYPDQYKNLYNYFSYAAKHGCQGVLVTDWMSVNGANPEQLGLLYAVGAAFGWSGAENGFTKTQTFEEFARAYSYLRYGVQSDALIRFWEFCGNFDGELLSCLPEKCRGWALRYDVFFNHNPLRLFVEERETFESALPTYTQALEKAETIFQTVKQEQNGKDEYFAFLETPLVVHRFIAAKLTTLSKAFTVYRAAAVKQLKGEEFKDELENCVQILSTFVKEYDEPVQSAKTLLERIGCEDTTELRILLQKENFTKLIAFIGGLKDGRRLLPSVLSISEYLFGLYEGGVYAPLLYEWAKDGKYATCKDLTKCYFAKIFRAEEIRTDI